MNTRTLMIAVATIAALSPAISNATSEKLSLKACARALASSMASPNSQAPAFRLAYHSDGGSAVSDFYPTEYTFALEAHDPKSGVAVARATCSTNSHGDVVSFSALPMETKPATLAFGF